MSMTNETGTAIHRTETPAEQDVCEHHYLRHHCDYCRTPDAASGTGAETAKDYAELHRWEIEPHPDRSYDTLVTDSDEEARQHIVEIAESHLWDTNEPGQERTMTVRMNDVPTTDKPLIDAPPAPPEAEGAAPPEQIYLVNDARLLSALAIKCEGITTLKYIEKSVADAQVARLREALRVAANELEYLYAFAITHDIPEAAIPPHVAARAKLEGTK